MRLSQLCCCIVVAACFGLFAQADTPAVPDALDTIPGVHYAYYDVSGATLDAILRSIVEKGPRDLNTHEPMAARTEWNIDWYWKGGVRGRCDLSTASASFRALVILPRLVGPVPPDVERRWSDFSAKLRQHEAGHARFAYEHVPQVVAALKGAPSCDAANTAAMAVISVIRQHDLDYDASTDHGRKEGVSLN